MSRYNEESAHKIEIGFSCGFIGFDPNVHECVDSLIADGDRHMYMRKRMKNGSDAAGSTFG